jgi:hypothetical protein
VVIATGADLSGRRTLVGKILDYNAQELTIELASGSTTGTPSNRVLEIQTTWNAAQRQADELTAAHRYDEAIQAYRAAARDETRPWVRRKMLAAMVTCYENAGQIERTGEAFLSLMKMDESWQYLERIPAAWTTSFADRALEVQARAWLETENFPPAQLLGASWLLAGGSRSAALTALRKLSNHADPRIAHLADAQLWRASIATAKEDDLKAWEAQIGRMPAELRAGPYLLLAKALSTRNESAAAAWTYMRVPILHPERHALAAAGLEGAARELTKLNSTVEATSLYQELADHFADRAEGRQAKEALSKAIDRGK